MGRSSWQFLGYAEAAPLRDRVANFEWKLISQLTCCSGFVPWILLPERPRVTEFPIELQRQAIVELATAPALSRMMDGMAADLAFNRAICR